MVTVGLAVCQDPSVGHGVGLVPGDDDGPANLRCIGRETRTG